MDDEVTRVQSVRYLEGASGHSVFSTLFLVVAVALLWAGRWGLGVVVVIVAFGIALNGLSIYAWDRLREAFESTDTRDGPDRSLSPHRLSPEMKAEMLAGATMVGTLVVGLVAATAVFRFVGLRTGVHLSIVVLGLGNGLGLAMAYRQLARE